MKAVATIPTFAVHVQYTMNLISGHDIIAQEGNYAIQRGIIRANFNHRETRNLQLRVTIFSWEIPDFSIWNIHVHDLLKNVTWIVSSSYGRISHLIISRYAANCPLHDSFIRAFICSFAVPDWWALSSFSARVLYFQCIPSICGLKFCILTDSQISSKVPTLFSARTCTSIQVYAPRIQVSQ